ncbi:MAG: class I SAM-dependent methyltransferase [Firmicutes bacterium]|nr:class I SAM-dependent methyltransferase [Bacillota bacterium]
MDNIYSYPHYYEIAYSYRDLETEADFMEEALEKFSLIKVRRVLEIACGNSPHLPQLGKRGYQYSGLDLSPTMLEFAAQKARALDYDAHFYLADLVHFKLEKPRDFIYILMGSLYVEDTEQLLSHFRSAARALKPGGLYFLDWCIDFEPLDYTQDSWVMRRGKISVTTHYSTRLYNAARQLYQEKISFLVQDGDCKKHLQHSGLRRAIFPQEFVLAATKLNRFELLGWWNDWDWSQPLQETKREIIRPVAILRRL